MSYTLKDRVLVASTSTGTSNFVLGSAETGYQSFSVVGDGASIPYVIQGKNPDGTLTGEWEVGTGTWHSSGNYITRSTVLESSNANALVNFSAGDKDVYLDVPSELIVQGPDSATANDFVAFDGTSGKLIKDSGYSSASFATAAQGAKADTAVQPGDLGTAAYLDAGVANGVATLDAGGKVPTSQIPALGDLNYQGTWNAATNTPTLTSSVGTKGYYYVVNVAGTTNLNGITDWFVGDWAVFNGTVWEQIDNTDSVTSVNGQTGTVVLTASDVGAAPATSGTSILYGNGTGGTSNVTIGSGISFAGGTLSATGTGGDVVGPASATDNAIVRFDTTTGKLIQNSAVTIDDAGNIISPDSVQFSGTVPATQPIGTLWFDSSTDTLNLQQNAITQQIGEEIYVYGKASNTISGETLLQAIVKTGVVGASGVIQFGVAGSGVTDAGAFIGMATEDIATNGFGRVTSFGIVHGVNTSGSTYGETWVDGQDIWYNPVTGGLTKTKPTAPNIKVQLGTVINAGPGGSGSFQVLIGTGSSLGGTDDNVQLTSPSNGQILSYDGTNTYWRNTSLTAGTGISVSSSATGVITVTNSAPDQTVSITGSGGAVVTGTYPNFTITTPSGTVTSVTASAPLASTGGATPNLTITQASGSTNGYLSSTDWTTFNNKGSGTVTSVGGTGSVNGITLSGTVTSSGSLTLGGTLSGVSLTSQVSGILPIANGGTNQSSFTSPVSSIAGLVWFDGTQFQNDSSTSHVGYNATTNTFYANNMIVGGTSTFNQTATFNGTSSSFGASLLDSNETVNIVAAAPSSTTNFYIQSGAVQYYTSNATTNWTLNIAFSSGTSLNTALATGQSVTFTLVTTQNSTAYYNSAVTIDGVSVTPKWVGGAPTAGNASGLDVYRFAVIKTASAAYTVIASLTQYK